MDTKVLSSGIRYSNLPESYVRPESERPKLSEVSECVNVPVIDLASDDRSLIVPQINDACKSHGFFQLPVEEKPKLYSDNPSKTIKLSTSFNVKKEKVHNWRDYLRLHFYPRHEYVLEAEWLVNPCKEDASTIDPWLAWLESPTNPRQQICDIHMLEAVIKKIELSTATVDGNVHGGTSSGDSGTVEFRTIHGTGSGPGGASSGPGGTVEFRTINDGTGGASSGAGGTVESAPSISLASTSSYDTSVAAHQSNQQPPPGIPPAHQNDQQPPPGIPPPDAQIEDIILQEEPRFNITLLAKTFMMVSATNGGTIVTSRLSTSNSLSENDKILLASAMACSTAGFLLCVGGYILGPRRSAKLAALLTGIGGIFTIFGFILMMSTIF